ncbi:MAG TPA: hypothetical protein VEI97_19630 [bacterium]|nr:hypothetical protein [bacterium]
MSAEELPDILWFRDGKTSVVRVDRVRKTFSRWYDTTTVEEALATHPAYFVSEADGNIGGTIESWSGIAQMCLRNVDRRYGGYGGTVLLDDPLAVNIEFGELPS